MHPISNTLQHWYGQNKRDLPWRNTKNPYIIWISEIILQQTRVEQGLPYFEKLVDAFPTINQFAQAKEDKILKMWQGLGYYSRARNMHHAAREIIKKHDGKFPDSFSELKKLKGIGDYTAAAIASFAFNISHPVVDGNVYRFLSRYYGIKAPVDTIKGKKKFYTIADEVLDRKNPALHNQAIMEFGALQCKPFPDCKVCPLKTDCYAFKNNKVKQFPIKTKAHKIKERHFNYLFIKWANNIFLNKRSGSDIWKNLYELPLIESKKKTTLHYLKKLNAWKNMFGTSSMLTLSSVNCYKHQLSHQTIYARFIEIDLQSKPSRFLKKHFIEIDMNDLAKYGIPRLIDRFFKEKFTQQ